MNAIATAAWRQAGEAQAGRPAEELLAWAAEQYAGKLTFATGFGAEGCVIIDLVARLKLDVDLFTLDTGLLFPETYALWRRLEQRYGLRVRAVRAQESVEQQALSQGPKLWERDPDLCCERRKVEPLRGALTGFDAWITAIRRDQTSTRKDAREVEWDGRFGLVKVNPLVGWTHDDVWAHVRAHDVPVNPLHQRGYPSIGCWPCTSAVRPGEDARAGRWRGSAKKECGLHLKAPAAVCALEWAQRAQAEGRP
jgi:phosphoadenylyl-sulfate reductase (thioredoxin)